LYGFDEFTRHFSRIKDEIEKEESQGGKRENMIGEVREKNI